VLDFKAKTITIDEIILPMRNINYLQGASMLCALKLNNSLAMEPLSTQVATKRATQILDSKYKKQISSQLSKTIVSTLASTNKKSYCSFSKNMSRFLMAL
jgi:hypothetical protein